MSHAKNLKQSRCVKKKSKKKHYKKVCRKLKSLMQEIHEIPFVNEIDSKLNFVAFMKNEIHSSQQFSPNDLIESKGGANKDLRHLQERLDLEQLIEEVEQLDFSAYNQRKFLLTLLEACVAFTASVHGEQFIIKLFHENSPLGQTIFQFICENCEQKCRMCPELSQWTLNLIRALFSCERGRSRLKKIRYILKPFTDVIHAYVDNLFQQEGKNPRFSSKDEEQSTATLIAGYLMLLQFKKKFTTEFIVDLIENLDKVFGIQYNLVEDIFPYFGKEFVTFFNYVLPKINDPSHPTISHMEDQISEHSFLDPANLGVPIIRLAVDNKHEGIPCGSCKRRQNKIEKPFSKCGGCNQIYYCSEKCQKTHWKKHKKKCKRSRQQNNTN